MKTYPLISVRDIVVFPGSTNQLQLGRPFTLATIEESLEKYDGEIVVTSQKSIQQNGRPEFDEIFHIGCLCKIVDAVKFPDGSMKILVEALNRIEIAHIHDEDEIRLCTGNFIENQFKELPKTEYERLLMKVEKQVDRWPKGTLVDFKKSVKDQDALKFIMSFGHLLSVSPVLNRQLSLEQIREGIFLVDTLSEVERSKINLNLARTQEILEACDSKSALSKIEALIEGL